jgi:hypothetical protein
LEGMEQSIQEIVRTTGATEQEARVIYLLRQVDDAWDELPQPGSGLGDKMRFHVHYMALVEMIQSRIVRREHRDGWPEWNEAMEAESPTDNE